MILWVLLVLAAAAILALGIERLIARLGVEKKEPGESGLATLAGRLEQWSKSRMRK